MTKLQVCLVTVAAFVAVASAFPYKAEPVCSPTDEGSYYPHPDCTKYYVCSVGNLIIAECGTGTVWNPEIEQCDFPYNVPECVGGTRPPEDGSTTPRPTTTTAEPTTSSAASSTTTEATTRESTTTEAASTTQGSTTPLPNGCPPVGVDKIPYPGSCVLYFICLDGEPHVTNCSEGLYFNPETKDCDQPQNVDCTEPTTTQATTTTTRTTTRPTTTTTRVTTTTTRPTTTTRASTTTTRSSTTTTRPSTTTSRSTSTTTQASTTANPEYECPEGVPFIYQPHPTDCTKFYSCENGTFQRVYACGPDFWFRFASQSCVQPWGDTCAKL